LEKGEVLAYAEEVCSKVEPVGIQKVEVAEQEVQEKGEREITEHLIILFEKSKGELNGQEQTHLLYSNGLHLRTHLFCIGQHFPLFQFYMVIG
jgi:hypothetical protein